jgi:hypothetical protein
MFRQRDTLSARVDQLSCSVKELAETLRNLIVDTKNNNSNAEGDSAEGGESNGVDNNTYGGGDGDGSPIMSSSGATASKGPQIVRTNTASKGPQIVRTNTIKGGSKTAKATAIVANGSQTKVVVATVSASTVDVIPPHK